MVDLRHAVDERSEYFYIGDVRFFSLQLDLKNMLEEELDLLNNPPIGI